MTDANSVGSYIGSSISSKQSTDAKIQKRGAITSYFLFPNYTLKTDATSLIIDRRSIGDYIVVGHSTNGQAVGTNYKVGAPADSWTSIQTDIASYPITLVFRKEIAKFLNGESFTAPNYAELGTGITAYDFNQTANVTPSGVRKILESRNIATTKQVEYDVRIFDRNTASIREIGLFNATSSGSMIIRYLITSLSLAITNEYRFRIKIDLKDVTPGDALITDYGLNEVRDILGGVSASIPTYVEWSNGTGAIASTDVALDGANKQRNAVSTLTASRPPSPGYKVNWLGVLTSAQLDGITVSKSGLFTASSGDVLFTETKFGGISKTTLFKVQEQTSITVR